MVSRFWVKTYLTKSQVLKFKKKYKWYKIYDTPVTIKSMKEKKFKRYAYFWSLHTFLSGRSK